jgi:hypothetical protein
MRVKEKSRQRRQNEWRNSTNSMVTIKTTCQQIQEHGKLSTTTTSGSIKVKNGLHQYNAWVQKECDQEVTVEHLI